MRRGFPRAAGELTVISFGRADRAALAEAYLEPFRQGDRHCGEFIFLRRPDHRTYADGACRRAGVGRYVGRVANSGTRLPAGTFPKARSGSACRPPPTSFPERCRRVAWEFSPGRRHWCTPTNWPVAPHSWADFWDIRKYPRQTRSATQREIYVGNCAAGRRCRATKRVLHAGDGKPACSAPFTSWSGSGKNTVWWEAAPAAGSVLAAGVVSMSSAYTLWFDPAEERNRHARIARHQSLYDIDSWAIVKGSPKIDEAYRFISFASSNPERQKVLSEHLPYGANRSQHNSTAAGRGSPATFRPRPTNLGRCAAHRHRVLDGARRGAGTALQFLGSRHLPATGRRGR